MKSFKHTWKRSVATLALFTSFATPDTAELSLKTGILVAQNASPPAEIKEQAPAPAENKPAQPGGRYGLDPRTAARYGLTGRYAPQPEKAEAEVVQMSPVAADPAAPAQTEEQQPIYRMDPRLLKRYGLMPQAGTTPPKAAAPRPSRGKQSIESKLNQVVPGEVQLDGAPLSDVVKFLRDTSRQSDPAKQGINFLISNVSEGTPGTGGIDPLTGQPMPAAGLDLHNATIKLHLQDVRLKDVLDAITKVADQPLKYSVEDYGVVFSPAPGQPFIPAGPIRAGESPTRLQVRTFRVDTNTFAAGLESAFGITRAAWGDSSAGVETARLRLLQEEQDFKAVSKRHTAGEATDQELNSAKEGVSMARTQLQRVEEARARQRNRSGTNLDAQQAWRQLLHQLGVDLDAPNKAVFYNELTGVLMVRGTSEDLELIQAAVETLGGAPLRAAAGFGSSSRGHASTGD